jgi:phage shock protein E
MKRIATTTILLILALGLATAAERLPPRIGEKALAELLADKDSKVLLLDVRTSEEYAEGHIPGAVLLPYDELAAKFKEPDKGRPIVVYCRTGRRSAIAADTLRDMGYVNVSDFGGYSNWKRGLVGK